MINLKEKILYGIPAFLTVALIDSASFAKAPEGGIGEVASNVLGNLVAIKKLILGGSFIIGIGLSAAGLIKLKEASDTQGQQTKYSAGVWRLAVGVCMVSLPAIIGIGMGTTGFDETGEEFLK